MLPPGDWKNHLGYRGPWSPKEWNMTLWLNKAKGKLFSLSVSPLLFSCLYIFNFHLGLSGFFYLFFPCFFRISLFSFIHSFLLSPSISVACNLYSLFLFFCISLTPPHLFLWIIPSCVHSCSHSACSLGACWMEVLCWLGESPKSPTVVGVTQINR